MITIDYIRGFFDGEGSVGLYKRGEADKKHEALRPRLALYNTSLPIILGIKGFLEGDGYHPTIQRKTLQGRRICYALVLPRWNDILRFIDEIGTEHPDKRAKFDEIKAYAKIAKTRNPRSLSVKQLDRLL